MKETALQQRLSGALKNYKNSFFLFEFLGLKISYQNDKCICLFPVDDFLFSPFGGFHAGLITTVIDITMAHLSKKMTGSAGATIELQTKYFHKNVNFRFFTKGHFWGCDVEKSIFGKMTV